MRASITSGFQIAARPVFQITTTGQFMSGITIPLAEKMFSADDVFVVDHLVRDRMVIPFAAWITWGQELIVPSSADQIWEFTDLLVRRQLVIESRAVQPVRFLPENVDAGNGRFQIVPAKSSAESSHSDSIVEGAWRIPRDDGDRLSAPSTSTAWTSAEFYAAAHRHGFSYGPSYHRMERIDFGAEGWRAELRLLDADANPQLRWLTALDAMLQGGAVLTPNEETVGWIPYRIDLARLAENDNIRDSSEGVIIGRWLTVSPNERVAQIDWMDPRSKQIVAAFRGVHYRKASVQAAPAAAVAAASVAEPAKAGSDGPQTLLDQLRAADAVSRQEILASSIEEYVLQLLKWDASRRKDLSRGLVAIGLDSLLAVDLQFRLQKELKFSLPPGTGLNQPTIADLTQFLLSQHPEFRS